MSWRFEESQPIYLQIAERLRGDLLARNYPPSSKFPTVRELAVEAGVNPNTMVKALQLLEAEGFLVSHRTSGRVVTDDMAQLREKKQNQITEIVDEFLTKMKQLGYNRDACIQRLKGE